VIIAYHINGLSFFINLNFGGFILKKERKEKKEKKEKRGKIINLSSPPPKSSHKANAFWWSR